MTTNVDGLGSGPCVEMRAGKMAVLAVAGLVTGLAACAAAPANEVVVDPTAAQNTGSANPATPPTSSAVATAETVDAEDLAPRRGSRKTRGGQASQSKGCCKGMNECKGQGGCKTDQHDCMGKNDCMSLGGCKTGNCDASATPAGGKDCCKGKNDCKGKGNCKTDRHDCMGKNDCKGKGGCKSC